MTDEVKLLPCPMWRNDCEFLLSVIDSCDEAEAPSCEMEPEDVARIDLIRKLLTRPPVVTDEVVERAARAICWAMSEETDDCSSVCLNARKCMAHDVDPCFKRDARAALASMPAVVSEGQK